MALWEHGFDPRVRGLFKVIQIVHPFIPASEWLGTTLSECGSPTTTPSTICGSMYLPAFESADV